MDFAKVPEVSEEATFLYYLKKTKQNPKHKLNRACITISYLTLHFSWTEKVIAEAL